jgi:F420-0:gamma-glutamyl ligase
MHIQAINTHKITTADRDLFAILEAYIPGLDEGAIVAITSKIVAICQGRVVPMMSVPWHKGHR